MNSGATVGGYERLRLFVGLPLPAEARTRIGEWQRRALPDLPDVRAVPEENLHVTVAFLGSTPAGAVDSLVSALREAALGMSAPTLTPSSYRETKSVAMIVLADAAGRAASLAERVFERLEALHVFERERRAWLPHVTVARFRARPRLSPSVTRLGSISPSEVALYHSVLRPTGAQYEVVESVALGGSHVGA